jgi:hypothetical protein
MNPADHWTLASRAVSPGTVSWTRLPKSAPFRVLYTFVNCGALERTADERDRVLIARS